MKRFCIFDVIWTFWTFFNRNTMTPERALAFHTTLIRYHMSVCTVCPKDNSSIILSNVLSPPITPTPFPYTPTPFPYPLPYLSYPKKYPKLLNLNQSETISDLRYPILSDIIRISESFGYPNRIRTNIRIGSDIRYPNRYPNFCRILSVTGTPLPVSSHGGEIQQAQSKSIISPLSLDI